MSNMEQIVRPFQSPNTINDKKTITILPKVGKSSEVALEWGSPGAPPIINGLSLNLKAQEYKEKERVTTPVRAENPDDPNQFIMEARIDKITFDAKLPPSAPGTESQVASTQTDEATARTSLFAQLQADGLSEDVAETMAFGTNTKINQPITQETGPDTATYTLNPEQGPDS